MKVFGKKKEEIPEKKGEKKHEWKNAVHKV